MECYIGFVGTSSSGLKSVFAIVTFNSFASEISVTTIVSEILEWWWGLFGVMMEQVIAVSNSWLVFVLSCANVVTPPQWHHVLRAAEQILIMHTVPDEKSLSVHCKWSFVCSCNTVQETSCAQSSVCMINIALVHECLWQLTTHKFISGQSV